MELLSYSVVYNNFGPNITNNNLFKNIYLKYQISKHLIKNDFKINSINSLSFKENASQYDLENQNNHYVKLLKIANFFNSSKSY